MHSLQRISPGSLRKPLRSPHETGQNKKNRK
jgi:hypothetical protein